LIKNARKDICNVTKDFYFKYNVVELLSKNPENKIMWLQKYLAEMFSTLALIRDVS